MFLSTDCPALLSNTLRLRRKEQHFADDIFKRILFSEDVWVFIKMSLKFVPKGPLNNIPALVQIMAWHHLGDKPLSETMMVSLPTHICITRPQWVDLLYIWLTASQPIKMQQEHQNPLQDKDHSPMYRDSDYKDNMILRGPCYLYNSKSPGHINGLAQNRHNSIAYASELHLFCTNVSL